MTGRRFRWLPWACWSVPVAAAVAWVVVAWVRQGAGVALSFTVPAAVVVLTLWVVWWLLREPPLPSARRALARPALAAPLPSRAPVRARPTGPRVAARPLPPLPAPAGVPSLGTAQLCWAWRRSYVHLGSCTSAERLAELAELRRGYLDELERRDPAAFARWFPAARAASDPARFYCRASTGHGTARAAGEVRSPAAG